jgi:hypothetical protein
VKKKMQANISLFEAIEIVQYLYSKDDAKEICRDHPKGARVSSRKQAQVTARPDLALLAKKRFWRRKRTAPL